MVKVKEAMWVINVNVASFNEVRHIVVIYMECFFLVRLIDVARQGRDISRWV